MQRPSWTAKKEGNARIWGRSISQVDQRRRNIDLPPSHFTLLKQYRSRDPCGPPKVCKRANKTRVQHCPLNAELGHRTGRQVPICCGWGSRSCQITRAPRCAPPPSSPVTGKQEPRQELGKHPPKAAPPSGHLYHPWETTVRPFSGHQFRVLKVRERQPPPPQLPTPPE